MTPPATIGNVDTDRHDAIAAEPDLGADLFPYEENAVPRIYLNNAATTWPKPDPVLRAVDDCLKGPAAAMRQEIGATGGTGKDGGGKGVMDACREIVSDLLNIPHPERLSLLPGCTYAINLAMHGQPWAAGDRLVISGLEHHAVSRPARKIARDHGVVLEISPYARNRPFDLEWLEATLKAGCVRMVAVTASSNVTGQVLPIAEITRLAKQHGVMVLIDAAQAAGVLPLDVAALAGGDPDMGPDMVAFAGHKGLFGPLGIGCLYTRPGLKLRTLAEGGTGGDSGKHEMTNDAPSLYEVGSHNLPAIAGLAAGARWVASLGVEAVHAYEGALSSRLREGLAELPGVTVVAGGDDCAPHGRTPVVSFTHAEKTPKEISGALARRGISTRAGFHCAPLAHETIGTLSRPVSSEIGPDGGPCEPTGPSPMDGTVRMSPGFFSTMGEMDETVGAVGEVVV
ncbi:MAG: aminotransferase class V-fold PLP-dependent enzyme [Planctomycetota bacterium]